MTGALLTNKPCSISASTETLPDAPLNVAITVNSQMTLAVAGGGRTTTLNFGDFVEGAKRSVQLLAYANQGFHLMVSSDNGGVMRPVDAAAKAEGQRAGVYRDVITIAIDPGP